MSPFTLTTLLAFLTPATVFALTTGSNLERRALSPATNLPGTWGYQACYKDDVSARTFDGPVSKSDSMTGETCVAFCDAAGYTFAGVEYGRECYCGYGIGFSGYPSVDAAKECNIGCAGNSAQSCGGRERLTVYANGKPIPVENQGTNGWLSQGCYSDSVSKRTLANLVSSPSTSGSQTVAKCLATCQAKGYHFGGVEYGRECWCGHSIDNNPSRIYPDLVLGRCDMACTGNASEFCGSDGKIIVYHFPTTPPSGWKDIGCYTDSRNARSLRITVPTPGGFQNMSIENCLSACQAGGYSLAGLEYGRECYCDNSFMNGGAPAPYPPNRLQGDSSCEMPCTGNPEENCGGADRLNAYTYTLSPPRSTSTSTSTSTATPSSTPTPSYILGNTGYFNTFSPDKPNEDPYWQFEPATDAPPAHLRMTMIEGPRLLHDTGNRCVSINDTDYTDSGVRGYCFAQDIILPHGTWELTIYSGRIANQAYASTGSPENLQWSFWVNGVLYGERVNICGKAGNTCTYTNGQAGSSRDIFYFGATGENGGKARFKICGYFLDGATKDRILFDDITLYGPT